jgi:hypothetical protein
MAWGTGVNTSLLTTYLLKKFIPALESELQFKRFTMDAELPEGMGNIARWNVFAAPAENTTQLMEGSTTANEISSLSQVPTEATIKEYGEFITEYNLQRYCQVSGARQELVDRLTYGAARSIDALLRNQADGTAGVWYAGTGLDGGGTTAAIPAAFSAAAIIGAASVLRGFAARGFRGVSGHPTGAFAAIISTKAERNMVQESTAGRMTWAQAVTNVPGTMGQEKWVNGYMGSVYGTAVYRSQNLTLATITNSSDENYILAEGGLGALHTDDMNADILINTPSSGDVGNPYRNRSTIAWHINFVAALLNSETGTFRVIKIYSAAT